jgi:hypothetical protein
MGALIYLYIQIANSMQDSRFWESSSFSADEQELRSRGLGSPGFECR